MRKTRMSASCAVGTTYLSETNTGIYVSSASWVITEQYFDLISFLV